MHTPGQIIILNGPPRSGKTSISHAIQNSYPGLWLNLGVDLWMRATPARYHPGIGLRPGGERPDLETHLPALYAALYESIAAHSRQGINIVTDVGHHDWYSRPLGILPDCARRLLGLTALLVGIHCPLDMIMERRRVTGWHNDPPDTPAPEPVQRWQQAVHQPGIYDLELDTSQLSPEQCAERIHQHLVSGPPPHAIAQLAQQAHPTA
jgi:chloramphenicol 3-O phosphotransferase